MAEKAKEAERIRFNAKAIVPRANEEKRKIKWRDRVELEMIVDDVRADGTIRRAKGKRFTAHRVMAFV